MRAGREVVAEVDLEPLWVRVALGVERAFEAEERLDRFGCGGRRGRERPDAECGRAEDGRRARPCAPESEECHGGSFAVCLLYT
ncbi:hypothetical protein ADL26_08185, partial [Thermoactinomyces vulgaris]